MAGSVNEEFANNLAVQKEELEALNAIYGEDFQLEFDNGDVGMSSEDTGESKQGVLSMVVMPTFSISIRPDNAAAENEILKTDVAISASQKLEARLIISFQPDYPTSGPPIYQLSIPWLRGGQKQLIADALEELYLEHLGESIVYIWVEKVRELLQDELSPNQQIPSGTVDDGAQNTTVIGESTEQHQNAGVASSKELIDHFSNSLSFNLAAGDGCEKDGDNAGNKRFADLHERPSPQAAYHKSQHHPDSSGRVPPIRTGAPLTDRKSTFQAHVAPVRDSSEIRLVLDELYQNKKIASATHNMYAYRILKEDSKTWLQDCDDDGETHAGSRLLHLLQILDCRNVIVVVSRWYGGIQLHADRFKHINNVARQALVEFGFVSSTDGKKMDDSKAKKGSAKK